MAESGDQAQRRADRESGNQEQHDEQQVDGQNRQLSGEEAAQHVELAQPLGNDARWRALEVPVGQGHQVMQHFGAHQRVEARAGPGRQPATHDAQTEVRGIGEEHAGTQQEQHRRETVRRVIAPDHDVDDQHHEKRREKTEQVDHERRGRELEDDWPHAHPERSVPWLGGERSQPWAQQQRPRAQHADFLRRRLPDTALDDIKHRPVVGAARNDDMDRPAGGEESKGKRQFIEQAGTKIGRLAFQAESSCRRQEGRFVEARCRHRRQAPDVGFADGPAHLLGDVEQGPHQRIDAVAARFVPYGRLEASVLEGSHASRVPETPLDSMI